MSSASDETGPNGPGEPGEPGQPGQPGELEPGRVIEPGAPDDPERTKAPRRGMCAAVLTLEAIVMLLSAPVLVRFADVDTGVAIAIGVGLCLACLVVAGMLRSEAGYVAGWILQVGAVGLGFLTPVMFFLGGVFAALWIAADLLGRRIEDERAAAWARYDADPG